MADIKINLPGRGDGEGDGDGEGEGEGERGERGERGHRGHRGHDGAAGATGATGPTGPAGQAPVITAPLVSLVYRPGATGVEAPGGNVFTDWPSLQTALDQTKYLGYRTLVFDNRFAPPSPTGVPPNSGLNPALIPAPGVPGTIYDHRDVIWSDRLVGAGGGAMLVEIADGAQFKNWLKFEGRILNLVYNGVTPGNVPFQASRYDDTPGGSVGFALFSKRIRFYNTNPGVQPMMLFDLVGGVQTFMDFDDDAGLGNGVALPAPVVQLIAGTSLNLLLEGGTAQIYNNAFVGPVGSVIALALRGPGALGPLSPAQTFLNPSYAGVFVVSNQFLAQRWAASAVAAGPVTAAFSQVQQVNATGGPITVTLPVSKLTPPTTGTFGYAGSAITVQEVGGGANAITVAAPAGETINGAPTFVMPAAAYASQRFWCNGLGAWFAIS